MTHKKAQGQFYWSLKEKQQDRQVVNVDKCLVEENEEDTKPCQL